MSRTALFFPAPGIVRVGLLCGLALLLAGPAAAREISGTLGYPERIALPPTAEVAVELRDRTGQVVVEERFATEGQQVPIAFALTAPDGVDLVFRAAVFDAGRPLRKTDPVEVAADDRDLTLGELRLIVHEAMGFSVRLRCGAEELTLGFVGDIARLQTDEGVIDLRPVPAASGARFAAEGDPDTWVWTHGAAARVSLQGRELPECLPAASVPALPFRAIGHEPPWAVHLDAEMLRLTLEFGATELEWPAPAPQVLPRGTGVLYAAEGVELRATQAICRDIATGMPHPFTATLEHGGTSYRGCGGDPRSLLTAGPWRIVEIEGTAVPDDLRPLRLAFDAERLSLAAPCNQAMGGYELTGEALGLGPIASTMMMCPEPLMEAEGALFAALERVDRFDIDEDGALVLIGADAPLARALPLPAD